jgi:uncharacterized membrane protein
MEGNKNFETKIERAFELERLILFSDAVFAIAITLLVINLKFPDIAKGESYNWETFSPLIRQFFAFCISFFFIGISWSRHLRLCRFLRGYDFRFIFMNLLYLFFIVLFPFAASTIAGNKNPNFMMPFCIYIGVIFGTMLSHLLMQFYLFKVKPGLVIPGFSNTKQLFLNQSKLGMVVILVISLFTFIQTKTMNENIPTAFLVAAIGLFLYFRIRSAKLKKAAKTEGMI